MFKIEPQARIRALNSKTVRPDLQGVHAETQKGHAVLGRTELGDEMIGNEREREKPEASAHDLTY